MDCELIKIIIQPILIIVGWIVIVVFGLKQIKITSDKNLDVQRTLIRENHTRGLANEVINIYKDVDVSIENLLQACNSFTTNLHLEKSVLQKKINFSATSLVEPVNKAYNDLSKDMKRLEMWLKISSPSLPHSKAIEQAIDIYNNSFKMSTSKNDSNIWLAFQSFLAVYQAGTLKNHEGLSDLWKKLANSLIEARDKLTEAIAEVNSELIKAYNKTVL